MQSNTGGFNAPSREAIYKRAMNIAASGSYTYNYEDFVTYDASYRESAYKSSNTRAAWQRPNLPPLGKPVLKLIRK